LNPLKTALKSRRQKRKTWWSRGLAMIGSAGLAAGLITVLPTAAQADPPAPLEWRTPGRHFWTVPEGVTQVHVDIAAGSGGNQPVNDGLFIGGHYGGLGDRVTGVLDVRPGQQLTLHVGERGGDGASGGGSDSGGRAGQGWSSGGKGGSGSKGLIVPGYAQGGGGGGGASFIGGPGSSTYAIIGGGGGAGGFGSCGGNPGGAAGRDGWKEPNNCRSNGGDPGRVGDGTGGTGANGDNAGSSSGQGGGGGGGGGHEGGGGGDASTDGGGGGAGGTTVTHAPFSIETKRSAPRGNGFIVLAPVYGTTTAFDDDAYNITPGNGIHLTGSVAYQNSGLAGAPEGAVILSYSEGETEWVEFARTSLTSSGEFSFACMEDCFTSTATRLQAEYVPKDAAHWRASTGTADLEVIPGATRTGIEVDPTTAVTGQKHELTATVDVQYPARGLPTGDVEFWAQLNTGGDTVLVGTAPVAQNGQAVLEAPAPFVDVQRVWARYVGDGWFASSTSPKRTINVEPAATSIVAEAIPEPTVYGQEYVVHAQVHPVAPGAGVPSGEVEIGDQTVVLENGIAEAQFPGAAAGSLDIPINYLGDERYLASESAVTHVTERAETEVVLEQELEVTEYGHPVVLNIEAATVAPGAGEVTGTIQILLDGESSEITAELTDSRASVELDGLEVGTHAIAAEYLGSVNSQPALSNTVEHEVLITTATVNLVLARDTVTVGTDGLIEVQVETATGVLPPGEVEVRTLGENPVTVAEGALADGAASLIYADPMLGEHELVAIYAGTENVEGAESAPASLVVTPAASDTAVTAPTNAIANENFELTALVTARDSHGPEPLVSDLGFEQLASEHQPAAWQPFAPGGAVQFIIDGEPVGEPTALQSGETDGSATGTLSISLAPGSYEVEAQYLGEERVLASASEPITITVAAAPKSEQGNKPTADRSASEPVAKQQPAGNLPVTGAEAPFATVLMGFGLLTVGGLALRRRNRTEN